MGFDAVALGFGARRAVIFVIGVIALVDLNQRLHFGIVVAVIAALIGGEGMQHADAAILFQIRIQNRARVELAILLVTGNRQDRNAALGEDNDAVAVAERRASLSADIRRVHD